MALTITLGPQTVPHVRVVIPGTDLTTGTLWELWASWTDGLGDTQSYRVRGGSGAPASAQVVLVDVAAPINTLVSYQLYIDGTVTVTGATTRTYAGGSAIVAADGSGSADFTWLAAGGDRREPGIRFHASDVSGRRRPPIRLAPVPADGGGSLLADTTGGNTSALRALAGKVCHLLHNPAACHVPDCDIPLTETVLYTSMDSDRSERIDAAHRRWSLAYLLVDDPEPDYRVPVSTWDEFDAAGLTWDEFDALGLTWDEFDRTDWTTVGV
jgi:hypothetical protein